MSSYIDMTNTSKSAIKTDKQVNAFKAIQKAASDKKWDNFGWSEHVRTAKSLDEIAKEFAIILTPEEDGIHWKMDSTYHSAFFKTMAKAVAPYMTDGYDIVSDNGTIKEVIFKDGTFACGIYKYENLNAKDIAKSIKNNHISIHDVLDELGYLSAKLWIREDIENTLDEMIETCELDKDYDDETCKRIVDEAETRFGCIRKNRLEECTDAEWSTIKDCIREGIEALKL